MQCISLKQNRKTVVIWKVLQGSGSNSRSWFRIGKDFKNRKKEW